MKTIILLCTLFICESIAKSNGLTLSTALTFPGFLMLILAFWCSSSDLFNFFQNLKDKDK